MKKCKLLLLVFMIPYVLPAQTWEGDVSTDWNTPGNWDGNQVPANFKRRSLTAQVAITALSQVRSPLTA